MFFRFNHWTTRSLDIHFNKLFSGRRCISWKCSDSNCSSQGFFTSTTDLCVGLISEPLTVTYWMSTANEHWKICRYVYKAAFITGHLLSGVSVLTLTAISVDRLLALLLGLRYRQVVNLKQTYVILIAFWIVSAALSAMKCCSVLITIWYSIIGTLVCLVTSIFSYTKIFFTLRHHQYQVQDHIQQPNQTNQLNIARYKKAVSTEIWLQLTLVACYLPHGVAAAFVVISGGLSASFKTLGIIRSL